MTTKKSKAVTKQTKLTDKQRSEYISKLALRPSTNAAAVVEAYSKGSFGESDINVLIDELRSQFTKVENGDLKYCESMLVGQANALQSIFVSLARRAANQSMVMHYETFLRLALKAQNQCRMTLESLATIKNPPVVYAKQANFAQGHQQICNGTPAPDKLTCTHAGENINQPNELLEVQHGGKTLDTSTTGATVGKNKAMATVD